ncbi:SAV_2336 N-terminal domain-related protein [Streptomyces sp. cg2]|uniref:SAV_2336 N-terminal domain-related protein n=1 Tax=Streptomyces sp. cg2 TaxID=3238799 RepID=UPI0034E1C410
MAAEGGGAQAGERAGDGGRAGRIGAARAVFTAAGVELDRHALLDALWLATHLPAGQDSAPVARALGPTAPRAAAGAANEPPPPAAQLAPPRAADAPEGAPRDILPLDRLGGDLHAAPAPAAPRRRTVRKAPPPAPSGAALPVRAPEAKALAGELRIGRALRPLRQRRATTRFQEFDEAATAAALAESGLPDVVLRPGQERWLDLVLLVDDGVSMLLWRRLAVEWRGMMQRVGAFRTVRVHGLDTRGPDAPVLRGRPFDPDAGTLSPSVLADPSGRTLVLLLSDGMGAAWRDGRLHRLLARWSAQGPVAVLHALPPRLWQGSGIRAGRWLVTTRRRGAAGASWSINDPVLPAELAPFRGLPVPVLESSAGPVAAWARLLASAGGTMELPLLEGPVGRAAGPPAEDGTDGVRRFRAAASPEAYRLAAHLAAVSPASVPVMRLVQRAVEADTAHLAEVFLGGLMRPAPAPVAGPLRDQHRIFDFPDAVRSALLDAVATPELLRTGREIGHRLNQLAGRSPDFPAWLAHPDGMDRLPAGSRAFSSVERRLMARLGASFATVPEEDDGTEPVGPDGWRPLSARDPRRLGRYTLHGRRLGTRSVVYLGRNARGEEAALRVVRPDVPPDEARALLATEAVALRRLGGQYAPWLLEADPDGEPPYLAMRIYAPSDDPDAGPPPQLGALLRPEHGSRLRRDTLLSIAYGWHLAAAVRLCHLQGLVLPELTERSVHVVGRTLMLTGLGRCVVDGEFRARGAEAVPTMADNVRSLGEILRRLGDKHRAPLTAGGGDMALWQGDTWRPLREIVLDCLSEDPAARPTAGQVAECFARYVPMAAELRDDRGSGAGTAAPPAPAAEDAVPDASDGTVPLPLDPQSQARWAEALRSARPMVRRRFLFRLAERDADERKLAAIRTPLTYCHRTTVVGVDSAVGRPTVTVALGALLADARGGGVIALDAGHGVGALDRRLHLDGYPEARSDLLSALPTILEYEEVLPFTVNGPSGLRALLRPFRGTTSAVAYEVEYRRTLDLLGRHFPVVLADRAALRSEPLPDTVLALSSRLIVVARRIGTDLDRAGQLLADLRNRGYAALADRAILAVTDLRGPDRPLWDERILERFGDHPGGLVLVPYDSRLDDREYDGKDGISLSRMRSRTYQAFQDLAALVAEDFAPPGDGEAEGAAGAAGPE